MIKLRNVCTLLILGILLTINQAHASYKDVRVVSVTGNQLVFEYEPLNIEWTDVQVNSGTLKNIGFNNAQYFPQEGQPAVPSRVINVGIPNRGQISVQILGSESSVISNVKLAPIPRYARNDDEEIVPYYEFENNAAAPEYPLVSVQEPHRFRQQRMTGVVINPVQYDAQSGKVTLYTRVRVQVTFPSQSAATQQRLVAGPDESAYKNVLLNYDQAKSWRIRQSSALLKSNDTSFSGENWYKISIQGDGINMKRDVDGDKEGMYKITGSNLQSAGVNLSAIDPATLQLFNNGGKELKREVDSLNAPAPLTENAILVVDGNDGSFDANDYILFYGRSLEGVEFDSERGRLKHYYNHYDQINVYWLTWGKESGKRIATQESYPVQDAEMQSSFRDLAFFEREEYNVYNSGTVWLDRPLSTANKSRSYTLNLSDVVSSEQTIVRPVMGLMNSGTHQFKVYVNGYSVGEPTNTSGSNQYTIFQSEWTTYGVLFNGSNSISIEYLNNDDIDLAYVDYIELEYARQFKAVGNQLVFWGPNSGAPAAFQVTGFVGTPKVFDITDFANVKEISGTVANGQITFADNNTMGLPRKYMATSSVGYQPISNDDIQAVELAHLRTSKNVDYIIITNDDFEQQAQILKSLRENWDLDDRLMTQVVKLSDVINEFGFGIKDPGAIRDFLYYAQNNWGNPYFVLLLGDGHFDYKNIMDIDNPIKMLTYQTGETHENQTRTTDDWFVYTRGEINGPQMAIGRLCVNTVDEAQIVVDKISEYETNPEFGDWRNIITMVGDDELAKGGEGNEVMHTRDAENLTKIPEIQMFNIRKIFLIEYRPVSTASISGITKPEARRDLLDQINSGSLIVNYMGHGNDNRWAHEKVLYGPTDFDLIQNGKRQGLWIAATCEFGRWDQLLEQSLAEELLYAPNRGAIGLVASSRLVYSTNNYYFNRATLQHLFQDYQDTGMTMRIGDAVLQAKLEIIKNSQENSEKYLLLGDPAMRLAAPRYHASIDAISPDSIQALQKMSVSGRVLQGANTWSDYQGKVLIRVKDSPKKMSYYTVNNGTLMTWVKPGNTLFRGTTVVTDGEFNIQFIVPKDISYDGIDGRISLYFWSDDQDGAGFKGDLVVGGTATDLIDRDGPELELYFGEPGFAPGDFVPQDPVLHVDITDSLSGINTAGDIGHQIVMTLDDDVSTAKDITDYFEYKEGSYVTGTATYPMQEIKDGLHTIKIKAWDNSNNSGTVDSEFMVVSATDLKLTDLLNYPNPMKEQTQFTFNVSQDAMAEISIYTVAGRLIRKFGPMPVDVGYAVFPDAWDGRDEDGDKVANGVYLYKVKVKSLGDQNQTDEDIGKLIIAR